MLEDLINDILLPESAKEDSHYKFIWGYPATNKVKQGDVSLYTDNFITISQDKLDNKFYLVIEDKYDLTDKEFLNKLEIVTNVSNFQFEKIYSLPFNGKGTDIDYNHHNIYGVANSFTDINYLLNMICCKYRFEQSLSELN